jgi:hypothetical protein
MHSTPWHQAKEVIGRTAVFGNRQTFHGLRNSYNSENLAQVEFWASRNSVYRYSSMHIHVWASTCNPNSITQKPNWPQRDCPTALVIAKQYSSASFFSLCFHYRKEIFDALYKNVIISNLLFLNCVNPKLRKLKLRNLKLLKTESVCINSSKFSVVNKVLFNYCYSSKQISETWKASCVIYWLIIIIIIIIIFLAFMQGIYTYVPETQTMSPGYIVLQLLILTIYAICHATSHV